MLFATARAAAAALSAFVFRLSLSPHHLLTPPPPLPSPLFTTACCLLFHMDCVLVALSRVCIYIYIYVCACLSLDISEYFAIAAALRRLADAFGYESYSLCYFFPIARVCAFTSCDAAPSDGASAGGGVACDEVVLARFAFVRVYLGISFFFLAFFHGFVVISIVALSRSHSTCVRVCVGVCAARCLEGPLRCPSVPSSCPPPRPTLPSSATKVFFGLVASHARIRRTVAHGAYLFTFPSSTAFCFRLALVCVCGLGHRQ